MIPPRATLARFSRVSIARAQVPGRGTRRRPLFVDGQPGHAGRSDRADSWAGSNSFSVLRWKLRINDRINAIQCRELEFRSAKR